MKLWVVGKTVETRPFGSCWFFCGVFSSQPAAVACCTDERHFAAPATLDQPLPNETVNWPGLYYPKQKTMRKGDRA